MANGNAHDENTPLKPRPLTLALITRALRAGWRQAAACRRAGTLYVAPFVVLGGVIGLVLLRQGWTPVLVVAAGAFMLVGPALLAGFFGIAAAQEAAPAGRGPGLAAAWRGFAGAAPGLWALALVCGLLFMIFVTDAAILYAYMVGAAPQWLDSLASRGVQRFVGWAAGSGLALAWMLYCVSAFAVPLLCERRTGLVGAVVTSVRVVSGNFLAAIVWALILSGVTILSVLLLPLLLLTLPWLAFASRALYHMVLPR